MSLVGRAEERAELDRLLADVRRGESRSLVLRGEAGIGKTALLEYLVESAPDVTVARAVGVESEMELAFASLHQLCQPMLDRLPSLPAPQRHALEIVFGLSTGGAPDRFLVALAVLSLLSEVSDDGPLLCVVDDAQWLDSASALTLAFVARRLAGEPVGIVFSARQPGDELLHVPELHLAGLRDHDARALLASVVRFRLDEHIRDRIVTETGGNPLALLELPRGLTATQLAVGGLVVGHDLAGRIEESFARQVETLSRDARRLTLLAAAEPLGDPLLLWRAAARLGVEAAAADDAETHGVLTIGERVTFRHPLARSAIYRSVALPERRAAHLALAEATDRDADPDRRAWHLAAATVAPDEDVAAELEGSAKRAQTRGGPMAAAAFLQRSVAFTADPGRRVERALAAAEANLQAGVFDATGDLLAVAAVGPLDELQQARVELLRGQLALLTTFGGEARPLLLSAARRFERLDPGLARDTYLDAWGSALMGGRLNTGGGLAEISRTALSARRQSAAPGDLLLDSLATFVTEGRAAAKPLLEEAVRTFAYGSVTVEESLRWGWLTVVPGYILWDEDGMYAILDQRMSAVRQAGWVARLALDLATLNLVAVRCGHFATAEETIAEAEALAKDTGSGYAYVSVMDLAAYRGREVEARDAIAASRQQATALGNGTAVELSEWLLAVLCNGLGCYQEVVATAREDVPDESIITAWMAPELLEAAVRCDDAELARRAFERVVATTAFCDTESAHGVLARSRALMSEGEVAERSYEEAIARLGQSRLRPELARAHLLYGEWLRRENRRVDARAQLRIAHDQFTSIGMEAFAERTRRELQATGARARRRAAETRDDLTAQERQIARMARDGLTNPEIGAQLFLSPRTVEWHLRKVFAKLGIRSRHELASALPTSESPSRELAQ